MTVSVICNKLCPTLVSITLTNHLDIWRILDPILFGDYPQAMRDILGSRLPEFTKEEKNMLQSKLDFIGVNHYTSLYVKDCIYSSCYLNTYDGNALVFTSGERDGQLIGASVWIHPIRFFCNVSSKLRNKLIQYQLYHNLSTVFNLFIHVLFHELTLSANQKEKKCELR